MTSLQHLPEPAPEAPTPSGTHFSLYTRLIRTSADVDQDSVRHYLQNQLEAARTLPSNLPTDVTEISGWVTGNSQSVAKLYSKYLEGRRAGGNRKYFTNKAHALFFLQHVAPSKLVDGAWLYGSVRHADDWRFRGLIRTYLEELGDGDPTLNHVLLYRNLLNEHDCAPVAPLDDILYLQGTTQLALGRLADEFLPEMLGYNLGYEQLPLHLLITAFELNELGIDPHYFRLHVTIDNASSGHALKAVEAVMNLLPSDETKEVFLERLRAGYLLNDLGTNSTEVIRSFDLEQEVIAMLENKAIFGQHMHSDYCRLEGHTINQWLATPGQCMPLLMALQSKGWIKRHQDPKYSRFWQLIDGPGAVMFGVFNGYEKQLLNDWISGNWQAPAAKPADPFRNHFRRRSAQRPAKELFTLPGSQSVENLIALMTPDLHPTPEGLAATRIFSQRNSRGASYYESPR
ncbi:heme oxygenase-like protein [Pseudomonas sp. WPR_5_2]|uniref:iron-containing redox enzyme family protein n=1 Tax=Pseudomonas sp. WPR_5_2 TaxID=1907371 RepID=UPI000EB2EF4B|nr:iron-containing redox enzyme family protein [Pseudomonas sp. WPR_5_2]RKS27453.1 heme oxygenase-like protein [Pseudomonas sp. WPR_5_2]